MNMRAYKKIYKWTCTKLVKEIRDSYVERITGINKKGVISLCAMRAAETIPHKSLPIFPRLGELLPRCRNPSAIYATIA